MTLMSKIQPDLTAIESALRNYLEDEATPAQEVCAHLLFSPGKRIRPLLAVLCARLGGNESQSLALAAAIEYLHAATLLHDDILDGAALRRGKAAAHHLWGNTLTVLGGDFLLARSIKLIADMQHGIVMQKIAYFAEKIIAGEIREISCKGRLDLTTSEYFEIITGKTAFLFEAACESGAHLGGLQPQQIVVLGEYGLNLGLAFQIEDDIMDYIAPDNQGKLKGNDLREGKATLPLLLALQNAAETEKQEVGAIFAAKVISNVMFNEVCDFIASRHGFGAARQTSAAYVQRALDALSTLPENETKTTLTELATSITSANLNRA